MLKKVVDWFVNIVLVVCDGSNKILEEVDSVINENVIGNDSVVWS